MIAVGVLTVSDQAASGEQTDLSGTALIDLVTDGLDARVRKYEIVPADREEIEGALIQWADALDLDLILLADGTDSTPSDVATEAINTVAEREIPKLSEATGYSALSGAASGIRGQTLILNLPGTPKVAEETFEVILPVLTQTIGILRTKGSPDQ